MNPKWPQWDRFRTLVDAWVGKGIPKESQAKGMGISFGSFTTWYSANNRKPGAKTLKLMAAYYQVPLNFLDDDPGLEIPGVKKEDVARLTPAKRLILQSVAQKLGLDDVTDEKAEKVWKAIDDLISEGKLRPPD